MKEKHKIFKFHLRADIRTKFGLGFPPESYTNNANESKNALIKSDIKDSNLTIPEFINHFEAAVKSQQNAIEVSLLGTGTFTIQEEFKHLFNLGNRDTHTRKQIDLLNKVKMVEAKESNILFENYSKIDGVRDTISLLLYQ